MERDIISQRVKSGIENAKEKGIKVGRPTTKKDTIPKDFLRYYPDFSSGKINKKELASLTGFSRPTIIKYIKIIQENDWKWDKNIHDFISFFLFELIFWMKNCSGLNHFFIKSETDF